MSDDKQQENAIPVLPNSDEPVGIDGPVLAGGGTIVVTPNEDGYTFILSDSVLARLAHLEAIEAAMKNLDGVEIKSDDLPHRITECFRGTVSLFELIRKGMKDNG
jgi:hypothetical protein